MTQAAQSAYALAMLQVAQSPINYSLTTRVPGTTYPNNTPRQITVSASANMSVAGAYLIAVVNGVTMQSSSQSAAVGSLVTVCFPVPPGGTYSVSPSTGTVTGWNPFTEIR